jgi:hypothetical protein
MGVFSKGDVQGVEVILQGIRTTLPRRGISATPAWRPDPSCPLIHRTE